MIQEQKQALHIENGKSFSQGEANENERRWDDRKIDQLNRDPANNYDRTRMHLNFEIGSDGKIRKWKSVLVSVMTCDMIDLLFIFR